MTDLFKLGLTGSIATGKTTVADMFTDLEVPVFDADQAVHLIYDDKDVAHQIAQYFPKAVRNELVDRKILSKSVAENPEKLGQLEAIIHPLVGEARQAFIAQAFLDEQPLVVFDVPLLFETSSKALYDAVLVTHCDIKTQAKRALAREGMTKKKLDVILARQMPQAEKIKRADFIIDSDQTFDEMRQQVHDIYISCVNKRGEG